MLTDLAMQTNKGLLLAEHALETLRQRRVILPALTVVERACAEGGLAQRDPPPHGGWCITRSPMDPTQDAVLGAAVDEGAGFVARSAPRRWPRNQIRLCERLPGPLQARHVAIEHQVGFHSIKTAWKASRRPKRRVVGSTRCGGRQAKIPLTAEQELLESLPGAGVEDVVGAQPAATGLIQAIVKIAQARGAVGVGGD